MSIRRRNLEAEKLGIADRIEVFQEAKPFVNLKDTKPNFRQKPTARLINPSKTNIGHISKELLDEINRELLRKTDLLQFKSTKDTLNWFKNIEEKSSFTFIQFDVQAMYPSISEKLLDKAILFAKQYMEIPNDTIEIIKHSRKSFVFTSDKDIWIKKAKDENGENVENLLFDVTMGSVDGTEVCELIRTYLLNL